MDVSANGFFPSTVYYDSNNDHSCQAKCESVADDFNKAISNPTQTINDDFIDHLIENHGTLKKAIFYMIENGCLGTQNSLLILIKLIERGAPLNTLDSHGQSALCALIKCDEYSSATKQEVLKLLISKKANVNIISYLTKGGLTPLGLASRTGQLEILNLLIDAKANINTRIGEGDTALHVAYNEKITESLIKAKANVDIADHEGRIALHNAVHNHELVYRREVPNKNNQTTIQALLEAGASVDILNRQNKTPLQLIRYDHGGEHCPVIKLLINGYRRQLEREYPTERYVPPCITDTTGLNSLPLELILYILKHLSPKDLKSIACISKTNRTFAYIAMNELFPHLKKQKFDRLIKLALPAAAEEDARFLKIKEDNNLSISCLKQELELGYKVDTNFKLAPSIPAQSLLTILDEFTPDVKENDLEKALRISREEAEQNNIRQAYEQFVQQKAIYSSNTNRDGNAQIAHHGTTQASTPILSAGDDYEARDIAAALALSLENPNDQQKTADDSEDSIEIGVEEYSSESV